MTDKQKIRQEIERRKKENMYVDLPMSIGRYYEDRDLLAFLDTLSEEPDKSLEEAAEEKYPVYWKNYPKDGIVRSESAYDTNKQCRDAFIAGAEWQKKRFEAEYELDWLTDLKKDLYELGRKDEREQMMEEAVEADVNTYELTPGGSAYVEFVVDMPVARFKFNDKVRIIIVKED